MSIRTYINIIESFDSESAGHVDFFVNKHKMTPYSHSPNSQGFMDKTESKLTTKDMFIYLAKNKFKKERGPLRIMNGFVAYSYSKDVGPYTEERISFDTTDGEFVRNVGQEIITDKT